MRVILIAMNMRLRFGLFYNIYTGVAFLFKIYYIVYVNAGKSRIIPARRLVKNDAVE